MFSSCRPEKVATPATEQRWLAVAERPRRELVHQVKRARRAAAGPGRSAVMALEVVLGDGRVIRTGSRARKSSAGYDLTGLMVGSEGTLGLVTELTLKLHGQPEAITAAICAFDTVDDAVRAVIDTIQMGLAMARIELLDTETVKAFNAYAGADMPHYPHLMVEFHGSETGVAEMAEGFGDIFGGGLRRPGRSLGRLHDWRSRGSVGAGQNVRCG